MTLSRTGYYCAIARVGFAALPTEASSQQRSLRDQLVGVWIPTAHETTFQGDGKHHQFGANPTVMMILDASGTIARTTSGRESVMVWKRVK